METPPASPDHPKAAPPSRHSDPVAFCFFFNDTATTEIYTLSLHDALPICECRERGLDAGLFGEHQIVRPIAGGRLLEHRVGGDVRDHQGAGGGTVHAYRDGGGGGVVQRIAV